MAAIPTIIAQACMPGPRTTDTPLALAASATEDELAIPDSWKGNIVKFKAVGERFGVRFSSEAAIGDVTAVSLTADTSVDAAGAPTANGGEPHLDLADGDTDHVYIDPNWTFMSFIAAAGTADAHLRCCPWVGADWAEDAT